MNNQLHWTAFITLLLGNALVSYKTDGIPIYFRTNISLFFYRWVHAESRVLATVKLLIHSKAAERKDEISNFFSRPLKKTIFLCCGKPSTIKIIYGYSISSIDLKLTAKISRWSRRDRNEDRRAVFLSTIQVRLLVDR